jgi:hypothetical protein
MFEDNIPVMRQWAASMTRSNPHREFTHAEAVVLGLLAADFLDNSPSAEFLYGKCTSWSDYPPISETERDIEHYGLAVFPCLEKWLSPESSYANHPALGREVYKLLTDKNTLAKYKKKFLPKIGLDPTVSEEELEKLIELKLG